MEIIVPVFLYIALIFIIIFVKHQLIIPYQREKAYKNFGYENLQVLEKTNRFFARLSDKDKMEFCFRVNRFIKHKTFKGMQGLLITQEMKILVSATAVQLTFGFRSFKLLPFFTTILIFPEPYFSGQTKRIHRGEVNSKGEILFSWKDFEEGYKVDDGRNLSLHEMAHALKIENIIPNNEYQFFREQTLLKWENIAKVEIQRIKNGENGFIRNYAATNGEEFFAVCVEYFFEQPDALYENCPEVYNTLASLLNQNLLSNK